ncbi:NAD(P)H-dependent oxidoreductase [Actinomadura madurae]|uniref:NADPH-dependent FMN reductase n=1 Tax=Actinomadura madurae TaxID=1993 RepID=UPI00399C3662
MTQPNRGDRAAVRLLALGGSTRAGSSSEEALRVAASCAEKSGAVVEVLAGPALVLPIYQPESPVRCDEARALTAAVRRADGLLIASPGYHGTVSGMIKNALDYIADLHDEERVYLDGLPVGCIAVAHGWQAAVSTLHNLRVAVHALRGWPTPLGAALNTAQPAIGATDSRIDESSRRQLETIAGQVMDFATARLPVHS